MRQPILPPAPNSAIVAIGVSPKPTKADRLRSRPGSRLTLQDSPEEIRPPDLPPLEDDLQTVHAGTPRRRPTQRRARRQRHHDLQRLDPQLAHDLARGITPCDHHATDLG